MWDEYAILCKVICFTSVVDILAEVMCVFAKDMHIGLLLDFYGELLPPRTYDMMKDYYEDDLSLSEIADQAKITRQGVRHIIKKGEDELSRLEECLHLAERFHHLASLADHIADVAKGLCKNSDPIVSSAAMEIATCADEMKAKL